MQPGPARSLQMRTEALNQSLARFGRHHAAGGAGQQPDIEPRFEMAHGMAERRLRHAVGPPRG